jgi:site-specific DNA-methyltransferase (adenine-specific)
MKDIPDKSVDLIVCDLPYGCLHGGVPKEGSYRNKQGQARDGGCAWDIKIDLETFWKEVRRIRRDDHTPTIHFCTTKFGFELHASNPKEFRYDLVWDKQRGVSFLSANKMPMRSHEMIYVFSKAGANYYRKDISGNFEPYAFKGTPPASQYSQETPRTATQNDGTKRCALSVIQNANKTLRKSAHPTEKPIDLYKFLIERYSKEGDTILDPTFGSGNSVFTAVELGRNAIGIEKDKRFFDKAQGR